MICGPISDHLLIGKLFGEARTFMLQLRDLAVRPDFQVGLIHVSPSRRLVAGAAGKTSLEPLIMQVFLLLLDGEGGVVTRKDLFDQCWGGVMVGDDSLNRAIAKLRRALDQVAPGCFEIETIPRTGYRLTGEQESVATDAGATPRGQGPRLSRRTLVAAGAATAIAAGGFVTWSVRFRHEQQFDELMRRGEQSLDYGDPAETRTRDFAEAVALRPDNPTAHGLLAYARVLDAQMRPGDAPTLVQDAADAAGAALTIDPQEPNARLAKTELQQATLDLVQTEDRLRAILATDPDNIRVMRTLWSLLQCVGRSRDALGLIDRALAVKPLAAANNYPRAQLLWILGRNAEADRVIDRAMQYWPEHRYVRFARFIIFAFTGRPRAALAMIDRKDTAPQGFSPQSIDLWKQSLTALDGGAADAKAAAVRANVDAGKSDQTLASQAVMTLSVLGDADAAFEVVNSLFVVANATTPRQAFKPPVRSTAWRFAPWLFIPPTALLRADRRFSSLCDAIGLTEYWARRGTTPDYRLGIY